MQYLESLFDTVQSIELDTPTFFKDIGITCAIILALSLLCRALFGKRSNLNHAISSAIGILSVYILGIFLYGTSYVLSGLLTSLPFVAVRDGMLAIFSFTDASTSEICAMLVRMIMLSFLVNLLDIVLPKGKNLFSWLHCLLGRSVPGSGRLAVRILSPPCFLDSRPHCLAVHPGSFIAVGRFEGFGRYRPGDYQSYYRRAVHILLLIPGG